MNFRSKELEGWGRWKGIALPIAIVNILSREMEAAEVAAAAEDAEQAEQDDANEESGAADSDAAANLDISDAVQVIDQSAVDAFANRGARLFADRDERERNKVLLNHLKRRGGYRRVARVPNDWKVRLAQLQEDFPNFAEVVDFLKVMFSLCDAGDRVPALGALLLDGPPGIGKTYVADRIAELFGEPLIRLNLEVAQEGSPLSGSSEFWSNSRPGRLFETLVFGDRANPVFLLDEIDKAGGDDRYDTLGGLYALLEPRTAREFHDLAYPTITLDASHVMWICTSNDVDAIPEPLQSRMRRFDVPAPTVDQCRALARKLFDGLRARLPFAFDPLNEAVCEVVLRLSPREMGRVLNEAIGRALFAGRAFVIPHDVRLPPSKPGIGFIW